MATDASAAGWVTVAQTDRTGHHRTVCTVDITHPIEQVVSSSNRMLCIMIKRSKASVIKARPHPVKRSILIADCTGTCNTKDSSTSGGRDIL